LTPDVFAHAFGGDLKKLALLYNMTCGLSKKIWYCIWRCFSDMVHP